ncbi:hypothetical protein NDU88_002547 [Pleurodeles waltl]|uniref:Uncharacterized protein n=1 Tax=Pleurodeles waltl TaxID=8319 RepID=A0AAV7KVQ8_PLEWA|nr:hypothetical protein NDU88_002547 [Pleurodeles waltl]
MLIGGRLITTGSWETVLRLRWCCRERVRRKRWCEEQGAETAKLRVARLVAGGADQRPIGNGKLLGDGAAGRECAGRGGLQNRVLRW